MATRRYWTLDQIRTKIKDDLDLQAETFVRGPELNNYINEAIDFCEAEVHDLYEDYFLTRIDVTLEEDVEGYDLPENIYVQKIRRVIYNDGAGGIYTIRRSRAWKQFEKYEVAQYYNTDDVYQYHIENPVAGLPQIILSPTPKVLGENYLRVWYIRQANRLEENNDICDIPEFVNFIFQYVKVRVYEKEGHPNYESAQLVLEQIKRQMRATLVTAQPDADNEIELDTSFYQEIV